MYKLKQSKHIASYCNIIHYITLHMKHFINLTSRVINKLHIIEIVKQPNLYEIHMSNHFVNGFIFFASGVLESEQNIIKICKNKDKHDFDTITEFINPVQKINE